MENIMRINSSNVLQVNVNEYDDAIFLDCDDASIFEKFSLLYDNIAKISDEAGQKMEELKKKYVRKDGDLVNTDEIRAYTKVNIEFSRKVMGELNAVFGQDFTDKVYRRNYEINPDFVPNTTALTELVESLAPVMEKAYGERIERNKSKYSAAKRGKYTKKNDADE